MVIPWLLKLKPRSELLQRLLLIPRANKLKMFICSIDNIINDARSITNNYLRFDLLLY